MVNALLFAQHRVDADLSAFLQRPRLMHAGMEDAKGVVTMWTMEQLLDAALAAAPGSVKRRGAGRPALAKGEGKAAIFSVRLTQEERARVEQAAQSLGLKGSAWARLALLDAAAETLARAASKP